MNEGTLQRAMGCSATVAKAYVADVNAALIKAGCTTVNRCAMYCAQVGHESVGLHYMQEIASGAAYEGRRDLGNTQPGDGRRFKGRGPIQLTGRHNYGLFGAWAKSKGLVDDAAYFTRNPEAVATSRWGFLAASWYWTVARPKLNSYSDAGNLRAATRAINGGTNGLADRTRRWGICRSLGSAMLPDPTAAAPHSIDTREDDLTPEQDRMLRELYMQLVQGQGATADPKSWGWDTWNGGTGERLTIVDLNRRANVEVRQARAEVAQLKKSTNEGIAALARQLGEIGARVGGGGDGGALALPASFTFTGTATPQT